MSSNSLSSLNTHHHSALLTAIKSADICVFFQTTDLVYKWVENLPSFLEKKWQMHARDTDLFSAEQADAIETAKLQVLASGECETIELHFDQKEGTIWYNFCIDCQRDQNGLVRGIITTGVNITQLRQREQVLKTLLREVCHRTKNLMAIIQSIANQTARFSDSIEHFIKKFQGRLQSISASQDLVIHTDWTGIEFYNLLRSQCKSAIFPEKENFLIKGDDAYLLPNAALYIGLALHELLINSLSFGALSQDEGQVVVESEIKKHGHCNQENIFKNEPNIFLIRWCETFDPKKSLSEETIHKFGSIVLEKIVPTALNGSATYSINKNKIFYELKLPSEQFSIVN